MGIKAEDAMGPVECRFTDPQDVDKYGDNWYRYSEEDLIRKPARELIVLERQLGMPIADVMNGMRMSTVLGDTAAAWLAVRAVDAERAGEFREFNPLTMLILWRDAEVAVDEGKDQADGQDRPNSPESPLPPSERLLLPMDGPAHSVVLPISPVTA